MHARDRALRRAHCHGGDRCGRCRRGTRGRHGGRSRRKTARGRGDRRRGHLDDYAPTASVRRPRCGHPGQHPAARRRLWRRREDCRGPVRRLGMACDPREAAAALGTRRNPARGNDPAGGPRCGGDCARSKPVAALRQRTLPSRAGWTLARDAVDSECARDGRGDDCRRLARRASLDRRNERTDPDRAGPDATATGQADSDRMRHRRFDAGAAQRLAVRVLCGQAHRIRPEWSHRPRHRIARIRNRRGRPARARWGHRHDPRGGTGCDIAHRGRRKHARDPGCGDRGRAGTPGAVLDPSDTRADPPPRWRSDRRSRGRDRSRRGRVVQRSCLQNAGGLPRGDETRRRRQRRADRRPVDRCPDGSGARSARHLRFDRASTASWRRPPTASVI